MALRARGERVMQHPVFRNFVEPAIVARLGARWGVTLARGAGAAALGYGAYAWLARASASSWSANQQSVPCLRDGDGDDDPLAALDGDDACAWRQALVGLAGVARPEPVRMAARAAARMVAAGRAATSSGSMESARAWVRAAYEGARVIYQALVLAEQGGGTAFHLFAGKLEELSQLECKSATGYRYKLESSFR